MHSRGARPTNDILMKFEIHRQFCNALVQNESDWSLQILHTPRQEDCRNVNKITLWSVEQILNQSTEIFYRISNSIEISLVGGAPGASF